MRNTQLYEFEPFVQFKDEEIDGITPWIWIKEDNGAWEGPKEDWLREHKKNILQYCKKFDCVISAGGCQGMYPRLLSNIFKQVYTFEPDPLNFFCLSQNTQKDNIFKMQAALGRSNEMIAIRRTSGLCNTGMHQIDDSAELANRHIPMLRIDDFHFQNLDLIHLDIEGSEMSALEGGLRNIQQHRPLLMVERGGSDTMKNFLKSYGYRYMGHSVADAIFLHVLR